MVARQASAPQVRGSPMTGYEPVVTEVWRSECGLQRCVQEVACENGRVVAMPPLRSGSKGRAESYDGRCQLIEDKPTTGQREEERLGTEARRPEREW